MHPFFLYRYLLPLNPPPREPPPLGPLPKPPPRDGLEPLLNPPPREPPTEPLLNPPPREWELPPPGLGGGAVYFGAEGRGGFGLLGGTLPKPPPGLTGGTWGGGGGGGGFLRRRNQALPGRCHQSMGR